MKSMLLLFVLSGALLGCSEWAQLELTVHKNMSVVGSEGERISLKVGEHRQLSLKYNQWSNSLVVSFLSSEREATQVQFPLAESVDVTNKFGRYQVYGSESGQEFDLDLELTEGFQRVEDHKYTLACKDWKEEETCQEIRGRRQNCRTFEYKYNGVRHVTAQRAYFWTDVAGGLTNDRGHLASISGQTKKELRTTHTHAGVCEFVDWVRKEVECEDSDRPRWPDRDKKCYERVGRS